MTDLSARLKRACADCPFKIATPLVGAPEWLEDVFKMHSKNIYFQHTCHKTDKKADGYKGGKKRDCIGHNQMIINEIDKTPGRNGVYKNINHLIETYLVHWLGRPYMERLRKSALTQELEKMEQE